MRLEVVLRFESLTLSFAFLSLLTFWLRDRELLRLLLLLLNLFKFSLSIYLLIVLFFKNYRLYESFLLSVDL